MRRNFDESKPLGKIYKGKTKITECVRCKKVTYWRELEENAKFGGYGFEKICDRCASHIDNLQDEQQGN